MRKRRSDRIGGPYSISADWGPFPEATVDSSSFCPVSGHFRQFSAPIGRPSLAGQTDGELERRARAIHDHVLTLDTHVDINASNFTAERALADHPRNLDDEQLLALKKNGGVVQLVALSTYVKNPEARFTRAGCGGRRPAKAARATRAARGQRGAAAVPMSRSSRTRSGWSTAKRIAALQPVPARPAGHRGGIRQSHRLRGQEDRHRSRRHRVGFRRRRRHRRAGTTRPRRST